MLLAAFLFSIFWLVSMGLQSYDSGSFSRALARPSIDYMKIGKGPLAISPKDISPEFEPLVKELVVLGKNTRPDSGALSTVSIGLKTSGDQKQLVSGQKLFLAVQGGSYKFTDEKPTSAFFLFQWPALMSFYKLKRLKKKKKWF